MPENRNEYAIRSRSSILDQLGKELLLSKDNNTSSGLLVLRVVSLHDVNIIHGYENGDDFMSRFSLFIHEVFPKADLIIRIGNNEFAILLKDILNKNHILLAINKILRDLSNPFLIKNEQVYAKVSIGAALFPDDARDAEQLLICADTALAKAVSEVKDYSFFSTQSIFKGYSNVEISKELDKAIDKFELSLLYQPKIDLQKDAI